MKKVLVLVVAVLLLTNLTAARASEALEDVLVFEDERMTLNPLIVGALPLMDGMLLLGASEYGGSGWLAYINGDGSTRWLLEDVGFGVFSCPAALDNGGFSVLLNRFKYSYYTGKNAGRDESLLVIVSDEGEVTQTVTLPYKTDWLIYRAGGYYAIGTKYLDVPDSDAAWAATQGMLTRLDGGGGTLWSNAYTNASYAGMTFSKGVMAADSLILVGDGYDTGANSVAGLIHRTDLNGQVMWTTKASLGNDTIISDICLSPSSLITGVFADIRYDEEHGFPVGRKGSVFCLDMDGGLLWESALDDTLMADYILPVAGGILLGSRGMGLEYDPLQGEGWLLLMDEAGNAKAPDSVPDISGGKLELLGMKEDISGEPLLYGVLLDEPGSASLPFLARLDLPAGE